MQKSSRTFLESIVLLSMLLSAVLAAPVLNQNDIQAVPKQTNVNPAVSQAEEQLQELVNHDSKAEEPQRDESELVENAEEMAAAKAMPQEASNDIGSQLLDASEAGSIDLTPRAVAEYLLITGDFGGFDAAINDLFRNGILTGKEVKQYRDDVSWEYENLISQMMESEANYLQEVNQPIETYFRNSRRPSWPISTDSKPELLANMMDSQGLDFGEELKKLQDEVLRERESNIDQLLQAIVDEYYWRSRENAPSGEVSLASENSVDRQTDDADMEKVIELIQEAMNGDPLYTDYQQTNTQNGQEVEANAEDEAEQELAQLPLEQNENGENGSGDEEEFPAKDEAKKIMPASA